MFMCVVAPSSADSRRRLNVSVTIEERRQASLDVHRTRTATRREARHAWT
jgi:hypothetical protein